METMMMKFKLASRIIIASFALMSIISCSSLKQNSTPINGEITIDADLQEWDGSTIYYDKVGTIVGLKNDDENLYLALIIRNQDVIKQIKMSGLQIWIDDAGNNDKKSGLKYPIGFAHNPDEMMRMPNEERPEGGMPMGIEFGLNDRLEEIKIIGSNDLIGSILNLRKTDKISAAIKYEDNILKYELKIPFKKVDNALNLSIDLNKEISVGLLTEKPDLKGNRMKKDSHEFAGQDSRQGMNGGGGRPPMGGGNPRGISNSETNLDLWIKVKLVPAI